MTKEELKINIQRLEKTISMTTTFQKAYIENCKSDLATYKERLNQLEQK